MTTRRAGLALSLALALAGCGTDDMVIVQSTPPPKAAPKPAPRRVAVRPPARGPLHRPPPPAPAQALPGIAGVIGATPSELTRQFGAPRLDVWEGDARKLQYSGAACVLDIYLYPAAPGREPQASYVDARRASDGQDVDRAACIAALRRAGPGRQ